jgi:uncharacterized RDD family membrane protein YckC
MHSPDSNLASRPAAAPAHAGWRLLALAYDMLPVIAILLVISGLSLWINGGKTIEGSPVMQWLDSLATWLVIGAYFVASWRRGGQTIGMRPWRLRVVAASGAPARAGALWLRYAVATATLGLGLLWALFDSERRALYDIVAGTLFVRLQPAQGSPASDPLGEHSPAQAEDQQRR